MPDEIRAIGTRRNNAELMADAHALGYLPEPVLDATYGTGRFWKIHRPEHLSTNDLYEPGADHVWDFTDLPVTPENVSWQTIVFDPPYKLNGTSTGKGPASGDDGYGVGGEYRGMEAVHGLIRAGMTELARFAEKYLLVKCQDQVCSGRVQWQTRIFADHGESLGLRLVDMLHVQGYRKQPAGRVQVHARRDYSTLLVFRRP